MVIQSKLSERDFIKANFALMYSRFYVKLITAFVLFSLLILILAGYFLVKILGIRFNWSPVYANFYTRGNLFRSKKEIIAEIKKLQKK